MRIYLFATMLIVLAMTGGCQSGGGSGWRWPWQSSGPLFSGGPPSQSNSSYTSAPLGNNPGGAPTMEAGTPTSPSVFTNPIGAMSAGFQGATKAVSAPFRQSPSTSAVNNSDPTSLSSPTGAIDSTTLVSWAKLKEKQGDLAQAEEFYRKATEANPNDLVALINYGRLFHRQEKWERAVEVYRRAIQLHPAEPVAYNDLAMCYASQGKLTQGIESLNRAVQLDPSNKAYRSNLAMLLVDAKRPEEALSHLSAAHPAEIAHYNLAYLLIERNEKALARQHLQIALQMKPQFAAAEKLLARTADAPVAAPAAPAAGGTPAINVTWPTQPAPNAGSAGGFFDPNYRGPNSAPQSPSGGPALQLEGPRTIPAANGP